MFQVGYLTRLHRLSFSYILFLSMYTQAVNSRLDGVSSEMSDVAHKGDKLSDLVGESEQPIVSTSVKGVNSEFDNLKETWRQRHEELNAALEQTTRFQADLVGILNWLQGEAESYLHFVTIEHV